MGAVVRLEASGDTGSLERHVKAIFGEVDQDGAWIVEEPYDVASEDVENLFDFTNPPGSIKGVVSDEGHNG